MKLFIKFTLMFVIIFYSTNCYSQIEKPITKGNITLGGDIDVDFGFQNSSYTIDLIDGIFEVEDKNLGISINPTFGYFIYNGLVLGISPWYGYYYSENITTNNVFGELDDNSYHSNYIGINVFVKYYFKNSVFIGLESGYAYEISKISTLEDIYKSSTFALSPSVGYAIFINSKISIEPSFNYKFSKSYLISPQEEAESDEAPRHNFFISVGFHLFL